MTDGTLIFSFDPLNPNSTRLRANSDFNSSQKLANVPLNEKKLHSMSKNSKSNTQGEGFTWFQKWQQGKTNNWSQSSGRTLISNSLEPELSDSFFYPKTTFEL
jgi:hypothetical protein